MPKTTNSFFTTTAVILLLTTSISAHFDEILLELDPTFINTSIFDIIPLLLKTQENLKALDHSTPVTYQVKDQQFCIALTIPQQIPLDKTNNRFVVLDFSLPPYCAFNKEQKKFYIAIPTKPDLSAASLQSSLTPHSAIFDFNQFNYVIDNDKTTNCLEITVQDKVWTNNYLILIKFEDDYIILDNKLFDVSTQPTLKMIEPEGTLIVSFPMLIPDRNKNQDQDTQEQTAIEPAETTEKNS